MTQSTLARYSLIAAALLAGSNAHAQGARLVPGGAMVLEPSFARAAATLDSMSSQYRRLAATATAPSAKKADRQELARFVREEIVPRLKEDIAGLYVTFDSLGGGAYAVPATLFDLDAIDMMSKDVQRSATANVREVFNTRTFALSSALEGYFAQTQMLVLPFVTDRLAKAAMMALTL